MVSTIYKHRPSFLRQFWHQVGDIRFECTLSGDSKRVYYFAVDKNELVITDGMIEVEFDVFDKRYDHVFDEMILKNMEAMKNE